MNIHQKIKGPAEAATSPSHGSNNPAKDQNMNVHTHTTAAPVGASIVTLDTVQSDIWHLFHLLDACVELLQGLDYVRDERGYCELDRISALSWIARDNAERLAKSVDANYHAIRGVSR